MARKSKSSDKKRKATINTHKNIIRGIVGDARAFIPFSGKIAGYAESQRVKSSRLEGKVTEKLLFAREELHPSQYEDYLTWMHRQTSRLAPSINRSVPTFSALSNLRPSNSMSFSSELTWIASRINANKRQIQSFLKLRDDLDKMFWGGNIAEINRCIRSIRTKTGDSQWLVEVRIAVEQFFNGLEGQKKVLAEIREETPPGFLQFMAHRISLRNESAVTIQRYSLNLDAWLAGRELEVGLADYLKFKLARHTPASLVSVGHILRIEQSSSDIDLYETFVSLVIQVSQDSSLKSTSALMVKAWREMDIDDYRLEKVIHSISSQPHESPMRESNTIVSDYFLEGRFADALNECSRKVKNGSVDAFDIYIVAHCYALQSKRLNESSPICHKPWYLFARMLSDIISKSSNYNRSCLDIIKSLTNLQLLPTCNGLLQLALAEMAPFVRNINDGVWKAFIHSKLSHPFQMLATNNVVAQRAISMFKGDVQDISVMFVLGILGSSSKSPAQESYRVFFNLYHAALANDPLALLSAIQAILNDQSFSAAWLRVRLIKVEVLLNSGSTSEAISTIADLVCEHDHLDSLLPVDKIIKRYSKWGEFRQYGADISLSILIDKRLKLNYSDSLASLRRAAVDNFLKLNSVSTPSQLSSELDKFERSKLVYFFKNLCVASVLDMCDGLEGSRAIDEERRRVLSLLSKLDPDNASEYQDEILSITSSMRIREGIKVVDGSRIHVDEDGISRWAKTELQENLNRYQSLVKAGIGVAENFDVVLRDVLKSNQISKSYLEIPKNEADELLIEVVRLLRDRFLFDTAFGLNSFLSKRVRHNSISGFIRAAAYNESLVTQKASGDYKLNSYWLQKFSHLESDQLLAVSSCLEQFSKRFDDLTLYLRNEIIQIRSVDRTAGLIELPILPSMFHILRSAVQDGYSMEAFLSTCYEAFWIMIEPSLSLVRSQLKRLYKADFNALFEKLKLDILDVTGRENQLAEFNSSIISAATETSILIDRAADWFNKRQGELSRITYTINEVVDISVGSALSRHQITDLEITKNLGEDFILRADSLNAIADIMLVVIGNIHEHSKSEPSTWLNITTVYDEGRRLKLRCESSIGVGVKNDRAENVLEEIRSDIRTGKYLEKISKEGRSGIFKVASIANVEEKGRLEFGFVDGKSFFLDVDMPVTIDSMLLSEQSLEDAMT
ncbi:hypothetical protein [Pseudomonas syringae]|uniref:Uncharacterized protein n=1 Tax=Pseudomonas syringae TaxID=317 RepID=A0A085V691_PSESX|nr:hypothetical protein [Pseudomonas syringae]KFE50954.1 hypothetical protein IV02_16225 [Pseudomonas syringae]